MYKALFILLTLAIGTLFPQLETYQFLIRYFLMGMLFFAFLKIRVEKGLIQWIHWKILGLIVAIALLAYLALYPASPLLAQAAFVIAIAPTAIATPIIADFMKKDITFVTSAVLVNNLSMAALLPLILPFVSEQDGVGGVLIILQSILITIGLPFVLSQLIRWRRPRWWAALVRLDKIAFALFLINIFLAAAKASHFVQFEASVSLSLLLVIAGLTVIIGSLSFGAGYWIGRPQQTIEASLGVGRKNTMFSIWIALTFLPPMTVLAPITYIVFQNLFNAWQLYELERQEK